MTSFITFAHRRNRDASIDSICTRCYRTIASAETVAQLAAAENIHLCDAEEGFAQYPMKVQTRLIQ